MTTEHTTTPTARSNGRRRRMLAAGLLAAVASVFAVGLGASPAGAATANGWYQYDADRNGYHDTAVWYANGRPTEIYQDTNRNSVYDTHLAVNATGRITWGRFDLNHTGSYETIVFFDLAGLPWLVLSNADERGGWDSLRELSTGRVWRYQGSGYNGISHVDPYLGMSWQTSSSFLTGYISAPTFDGNISLKLTQVIGLAAAMHPYRFG